MNFTVGRFNIGEPACLGCKPEVWLFVSLRHLSKSSPHQPGLGGLLLARWLACPWGAEFGGRTFITIAGGEPLG